MRDLDFDKAIVVDTETTGLPGNYVQEVLSLAITDLDGNVLFNELIKPTQRKRWTEAQKIHGIKPSDVKDKQTLAEHADVLSPIFKNASVIVGYNVKFDIDMLRSSGFSVPNKPRFDVMRAYANAHNGGRYVKLYECARHYGHTIENAHDALADTTATAKCCKALINEGALDDSSKKSTNRVVRETDYVVPTSTDTPTNESGCTGCAIAAGVVICLAALIPIFLSTCS